jgi:glycolate oxidase FAD binding subunit
MTEADPALAALIDQVRAARAYRTPLNITGGSTKAFYGEVPRGQTLDIRGLCGISSYEPSELVVTARAGTPLAELEATLAEQGQCLAFEPPRFGAASTVGGMVSAGLAGPARAAAGGVRDHVLGATLLNSQGELLSFGGQVIKNVAGYDVSRLLAGAMGVLGVVCEVSLKVLPLPVASATLRFEMDEAQALHRLNTWGGQPLPISASAWWQGMLVLRLSGAAAAVQSARRTLGGEDVDAPLAEAFWTGLRDQNDEFFAAARTALGSGATLWRLSLPQTAPATALPGEHLVEWGGAQRWVVTTASATAVRELAQRLGGHATAFAGAKTGGVFAPLSAPLDRIHRQLKAAFDPDGLFNPGRLYPAL